MELLGKSPKDIRDAGVHLSFVPEDRLGMGLVGTMGMTDNMMLKSYGEGRSPLVDHRAPRELAEKIRKELGVVTPGLNTPVSRLSGGNVQKGAGWPRAGGFAHCADDGLRRARPGHQYILHHLQPAE